MTLFLSVNLPLRSFPLSGWRFIVTVGKVMAKDEAAGAGGAVAAAAVAAVEKHFAMHGIYGIPPSAGAMPPSPQTQRPIKHSGSREEATQDEQDYLSTPHSKYRFNKRPSSISIEKMLYYLSSIRVRARVLSDEIEFVLECHSTTNER